MVSSDKNEKKSMGLAREICIWKDQLECGDCELNEKLFCRPKLKYMIYFTTPFFIGIIPVALGMLISANIELLWKIIFFTGWIGYSIFFFFIWESRMVCNHCPYYANDEQKTLHCPIDRGKLKTGKYNPGPLSKSEKIQFIIGVSILVGYPFPFLIIFNLFIPLIIYIAAIASWLIILQFKICTDCVNFACVLNRVPKSIRSEFMNRNPIIKKAWEEEGYHFD
ncbi:MAG: hypothetical protein ACFFBP_05245 [Promethearchaeota archaeon]